MTLNASPTSTVNYTNTEAIDIFAGAIQAPAGTAGSGTGQDTVTLNGTGGANAFTVALDATGTTRSFGAGNVNVRRDLTARVDAGPTITVCDLGQNAGPTNSSDLNLNGLGGDASFSVNHFSGAVIDQVRIDGGASSTSDSVQVNGTTACARSAFRARWR